MICNSEVIYFLLLRRIFVLWVLSQVDLMFVLKFVGTLPKILILSWSLFSFLAKRECNVYFYSLLVCWYWLYNRMEISFYSLFVLLNFFLIFSPISVCLLGWFRLFGIKQQYTGGVNLSISGFFWWIIGLKIICNGMQCEKFVSVPVVAVLGTVHILRKHIFMHFGPPSPYVSIILGLKVSKNWLFLSPSLLRNIWMLPK